MMRCVIGRAWIRIPAPVATRSCSTTLEYKCVDLMRVYKHVAYIRFVLGWCVELVESEQKWSTHIEVQKFTKPSFFNDRGNIPCVCIVVPAASG
jgi:hypothetical protein